MNSKIFYRAINCFRDSLEDLRLQDKITRDQENLIWDKMSELLVTARSKNPFKVKCFDESTKEQFQQIRAQLDGESVSDLVDSVNGFETSYLLFLQKIESKEDSLKKMTLLTQSEREVRKIMQVRLKKMKLGLIKECSFLSEICKELDKIKTTHIDESNV